MRLKIFSYVPNAHVPAEGIRNHPLFTLVSAEDAKAGIPAALAPLCNRVLATQFSLWFGGLGDLEFVGFESADRPLFVDPMRADRLAAEHPAALRLRNRFVQDWRAGAIGVSPAEVEACETMRAAFNDADYARLDKWISRLDAACPPVQNGMADRFRQAHLAPGWEAVTAIAQETGIFRATPAEYFSAEHWSWHNSFILRAELFGEFMSDLAEIFTRALPGVAALNAYSAAFYAERLFGVYLRTKILLDGFMKLAELPVLLPAPAEPPQALPEDFDPQTYLQINLDVWGAGMPAENHYLAAGWKEGRIWSFA